MMRSRHVLTRLPAAILLFALAVAVLSQTRSGVTASALQLTPVLTGLTSPVFVGSAHDGSNRLFILEQPGVIRVAQPGASTPTVFLDIRSRVAFGGEQGLLGLAFHPHYLVNGRFFVYYTRPPDGTIVIAEYHVSADRDVANPAESVVLTIPHPVNANHNGGMLAFGPDGYLYAGVGDGGSGNDPPSNAQNLDVLLGKIIRLDIDPPAGSGVPYLSPISNPFYGAIAGRDEIFAYGLRNPWRFSFDARTGVIWVGDVGQNAREEVDTPIVSGGNYGWRIYEGFLCTGIDPALCTPGNYLPPILDYDHIKGRCSITGGYVYRGTRNTMPAGTYLFADYCTGEIFTWDGQTQTLIFDTTMNISSFGEDENGELYVVDLNGTISRFQSSQGCSYALSTQDVSIGASGGPGAIRVTADAGCAWSVASHAPWIHIRLGGRGTGPGTVGYYIDANDSGEAQTGTISIAGLTLTIHQAQ